MKAKLGSAKHCKNYNNLRKISGEREIVRKEKVLINML